jgi:hypothetical protein
MADEGILRELVHKIGFNVDLTGLKKYDDTVKGANTRIDGMIGKAGAFTNALGGFAKKMVLPLEVFSLNAVRARINQERLQAAWGGMLHSMPVGIAYFQKLNDVVEKTQFNRAEIQEYGKELFKLKVPVNDIIPRIKMFSDIAAGTGQEAGALMTEWAEARLNPIMRGRMLQRMMLQGAVSDADLRKAGLDPRLVRREGGMGRIGMGTFDKIFNAMYESNQGMAEKLSDTMGKNLENIKDHFSDLSSAFGEMIAGTFHLNTAFKIIGLQLKIWTLELKMAPQWLKTSLGIGGGLLAAAGLVKSFTILSNVIGGLSGVAGVSGTVATFGSSLAGLTAVLLPLTAGVLAAYLLLSGAKNKEDKIDAAAAANATKTKRLQSLHTGIMEAEKSGDTAKVERLKGMYANVAGGKVLENYNAMQKLNAPVSAESYAVNKRIGGPSITINDYSHVTLPPGTTEQHKKILTDHKTALLQHIVTSLQAATP